MTNADRRHLEFQKKHSVKALDLAKRALKDGNIIVARHAYRMYQRSVQEIRRYEAK